MKKKTNKTKTIQELEDDEIENLTEHLTDLQILLMKPEGLCIGGNSIAGNKKPCGFVLYMRGRTSDGNSMEKKI